MRWLWLLILLPAMAWLVTLGLRRLRGRANPDPLEDPERRRKLEDEARRRRDRASGPTVGGGQHLG